MFILSREFETGAVCLVMNVVLNEFCVAALIIIIE
eukprot:COSAG05_NODE_942_length_6503_cov_11.183948_2_plen_35_part_00